MKISRVDQNFSVCKVEDLSRINNTDEFFFIGKTDGEFSLVCAEKSVPENTVACEHGWRAFRVEGVLDFSLVGILSKITTILAREKIGIFAISTYDTDYILTKAEDFEQALDVLGQNGYECC